MNVTMSDLQLTEAEPKPPSRTEGNGPRRRGEGRGAAGRQLPLWLRGSLLVLGGLLLLVGIAGLVLPGIQGILTILLALAILSLASRWTHRFLRWSLGPWPRLRKRVERMRRKFRGWLHRVADKVSGGPGPGRGSGPDSGPGS